MQAEMDAILKDYVGRESPLYHAERLSEHYRRYAQKLPAGHSRDGLERLERKQQRWWRRCGCATAAGLPAEGRLCRSSSSGAQRTAHDVGALPAAPPSA